MTTDTKIPEGTRQLAEWAAKVMWPCEYCDGERHVPVIAPFLAGPCIDCLSDQWLSAAIANPYDDAWWLQYADHLEETAPARLIVDGQTSAPACEVARMVARLLPLDVWPEVSEQGTVLGWWAMESSLSEIQGGWPICSSLERLGFERECVKTNGALIRVQPSILAALLALDEALLKRNAQEN